VDAFLQTTKPNIWALGDATGRYMFRHTANYEAEMVWLNASTDHRHQVDYHAVPHAVYGYPQVGAVGLTEQQAKDAGYEILVGRARYMDVTKGYAMAEEDGLAKVVVEQGTGKILGCHIVGPHAAILVQQIVYLMNAGERDYMPLADSQVIHPSLSEVVINAFANMAPPGHVHVH
jgi:dihydrolipoamide dehydrogenase